MINFNKHSLMNRGLTAKAKIDFYFETVNVQYYILYRNNKKSFCPETLKAG